MEKVRVYYDRVGNSLTVLFDDPEQEHICDEVDDDVVLMKDEAGRVIGFERLNFLSKQQQTNEESPPGRSAPDLSRDGTSYRARMSMATSVPLPPPGPEDLPVELRISYNQTLRHRVAAEPRDVPVPNWHQNFVRRRLVVYQNSPDAGRAWSEIQDSLMDKL